MGMNVSDTLAGTFKLKASTTIAINDAVGIGPDGRGYPIAVTDYAAVTNCTYGTAQTSTATGRIVAQTAISSYLLASKRADKPLIAIHPTTGDIYTLAPYAAGVAGLKLFRCSAAGTALGSVVITQTAGYFHQTVDILSNGDVLVTALNTTFPEIRFAIYSPSLAVVKTLTSVATTYSMSGQYGTLVLSTGGFVFVYQHDTNYYDTYFAAYDNVGTQTTAPVSLAWTRTGTVGYPDYRVAELSSGNLAIAANTSGVSSGSIGLYKAIISKTGSVVSSFTNISGGQVDSVPNLVVVPGYFCIVRLESAGSNQNVYVFNDAGVQQGTTLTLSSNGAQQSQRTLVTDGTAFWLTCPNGSASKELSQKILTTGAASTVVDVTTSSPYANPNILLSSSYQDGMIVHAFMINNGGGVKPFILPVDIATGQVLSAVGTYFGVTPAASGDFIQIVAASDRAFIAHYGMDSVPVFCVGKYANTSIAGVAASSAVENGYANVYQAAGTYTVNTLKGSPAVTFDHTTGSTIAGNKGTILTNGLVLKGM